MRRLVLRSFQSPGDILMLTAAVRDLHAACPGRFQTDVRTSADAIWENNPSALITTPAAVRLEEGFRAKGDRIMGASCFARRVPSTC